CPPRLIFRLEPGSRVGCARLHVDRLAVSARIDRGRLGLRVYQGDVARTTHGELADPAEASNEARRARRPAEAAPLERVRERIERDGSARRHPEELARPAGHAG